MSFWGRRDRWCPQKQRGPPPQERTATLDRLSSFQAAKPQPKTPRRDSDILSEITWEIFAWFLRQGVPSPALLYPELPRRARVVFHEDQPFFDLAEDVGEDGVDALIFLARDDLGDCCDLVAWNSSRRKIASWFGAAALLGADDILAPRLTPEGALPIYRTPLEWLRAGREGVVIVEACRAALELRDFGPLAAEDQIHGLELQRLFRRTEPEIYVPERRAA